MDKKRIAKLKAIAKNLPRKTGVYQIKNGADEVIYVGKAKNVHERIKGHFFNPNPSPRARKMIENSAKVDFIETANEVEALVLENNLIKEIQPKYNILLRDDKTFFFIKMTVQEDFPRLLLVRQISRDGARYFGPKTSSTAARKTVELLQTIFKFRTCALEISATEGVKKGGATKIPCLEHFIQKCDAPCVGKIARADYRESVESALKFLQGDTREILAQIRTSMEEAAKKGDFEKAAQKRDLLFAVQNFSEKQIAADTDDFSADIVGAVAKFDHAFFHLFQIRAGKIIGSEDFVLPLGEDLGESLQAFLRDYAERNEELPAVLVLSGAVFPSAETASWEEYLGGKIKISLPQRGKRKDLLVLAEKNAENYAARNAPSFLKRTESAPLEELQKALGLAKKPRRIEAYDISHLGGTETVASMIVFVDGEAKKAHYRKFKITSLKNGEIDDFKAMNEVLARRFKRLEEPLPKNFTLKKALKKDMVAIGKFLAPASELPRGFYALKFKEKLAGFAREAVCGETHLITDVFVLPAFRGRGLSRFLIRKIIETSKAKKLYKMACGGEKAAEAMENLGFERIKKAPSLPTDEAICTLKEAPACSREFLLYQKTKKDESFATLPDVVLIDGGRGQLSAALKALPRGSGAAVCALAKKEEEIFVPGQKTPLAVAKDSALGLFLQQIRDEAHNFAVSFNRHLRDKKAQKSALDGVAGIGTAKKKALLKAFGSVAGVRSATDEEVEKAVGKKGLKAVREGV